MANSSIALGVPSDWDDDQWITFEVFCQLFGLPQRTVRDWRRRGVGPRWTRVAGTGRLYITVRDARRFPAGTPSQSGAAEKVQ